MSKTMEILAAANAILRGQKITIAKAEGEDPDTLNSDSRVEGVSPDPQKLEQARTEAQAGQQAAMENTGEPVGSPNSNSPAPISEPNEQVAKGEIISSILYLAKARGITGQEIAKAFSGLEGDPAESLHPLGQGEKFLESIVTGVNAQGKVLEAIANSIADLAREQVSLKEEVAKSFAETADARVKALEALNKVQVLPRTAPALQPKGMPFETIAKSQNDGKPLSHEDVFQLALDNKLSHQEIAQLNRRVNQASPIL